MNLDDKLLVSRLDGFVDAIANIRSPSREVMYGAFFLENMSQGCSAEDALKSFYDEPSLGLRRTDIVKDWLSWLDGVLCQEFVDVSDKVKFALVWQILEMVRQLTSNFSPQNAERIEVLMEPFEGFCVVIPLDKGFLVLQLFKRRTE